jgi:type II secretory pathway pseudopilin PulG
MIVVVIVGILFGIAAPSWLGFLTQRNLNMGQEQAFQAIRVAQVRASQSQSTWQASFREVGGEVYWATHPASIAPQNASWEKFVGGMRIDGQETTLASQDGVYRVQFNHKGGVNGQLGKLTLTSQNGSATKRCVVVSTLLGVVRKAKDQERPDAGGRYCY